MKISLMNNRLMQENDEEEKHIRQAIAGDQHAFAELVNTHQRFLYNLALRAVSNPQDAQDSESHDDDGNKRLDQAKAALA